MTVQTGDKIRTVEFDYHDACESRALSASGTRRTGWSEFSPRRSRLGFFPKSPVWIGGPGEAP